MVVLNLYDLKKLSHVIEYKYTFDLFFRAYVIMFIEIIFTP